MPDKRPRIPLPRLHLAAIISASILFGCAFVLHPTESKRVRVDIPLIETEEISLANASVLTNTKASVVAVESTEAKFKISPIAMQSMATTKNPAHTTGKQNSSTPNNPVAAIKPDLIWKRFKVEYGDSLYRIFSRAGLDPQVLVAMTASIENKAWTKIFPGEVLEFGFNGGESGQLEVLKINRSRLEKWHITALQESEFILQKHLAKPDIQLAYREGTINSSLFLDAKKAGMSDNLTMELANIFGWDIDFILDIRRGDSFKLVYEEQYLGDERIGEGNIVSAQFINRGKTYTAVLYRDPQGRASYYTPSGDSMKKAFRRSPIDFARVSSHFNLKRKHPVLHKIRAHKGTDYAAGSGTPIKSTGDGKVIFAGRKGGYGKVVIIQHGQSISTLYAHMKSYAKGIRAGKRVSQGNIIGYVGSTGMATGPHLHYEFRVNGIHKNPLTVPLPKANPVARAELKRFQEHAALAVAQLESHAAGFQIAQSEGRPDTRDL